MQKYSVDNYTSKKDTTKVEVLKDILKDGKDKMVSKEEYVLVRVETHLKNKLETNKPIHAQILIDLIDQWKFDYEMESEYRPEILIKK